MTPGLRVSRYHVANGAYLVCAKHRPGRETVAFFVAEVKKLGLSPAPDQGPSSRTLE